LDGARRQIAKRAKDFRLMQSRGYFAFLTLLPIFIFFGVVLYEEFRRELWITSENLVLRRARKRERLAVEMEFPLIVELFAILIGGGMSPSSALARISEKGNGEFHAALLPIISEMRAGVNLAQALDLLNEQVNSPIVRRFCDSLAISIERGSSLIDVMGRQVEEVRQRQRLQIADRAAKAEVALMIPVVFLILPISILFALWPSYFALGGSFGGG
jgi:tight adherence protein C